MLVEIIEAAPTIATSTGATAATLVAADRFLPERAKSRLLNAAETTWIWISYQKTWPYLKRMREFPILAAVFVSGLILTYVATILYVRYNTIEGMDEFLFAIRLLIYQNRYWDLADLVGKSAAVSVGSAVAVLFAFRFVYLWMVSGENGLLYLARSTACFAAIVVVVNVSLPYFEDAPRILTLGVFSALTVLEMISGVAALWVLAVYSVAVFMKVVQIILGKITQNERGPIVGLSALLVTAGEGLRQLNEWEPLRAVASRIDAWITLLIE